MKTRTTLALIGVFAAILAYWLLFERHAKTPQEAARDAKRVFPADGQEVRSLTFERPNQPKVRLERSGETWRMIEPVAARADKWSADAAAAALLEMEQSRSIKNDRGEKGLEEMGLKPARAKVTFTLGPKDSAGKGATPGGPAGAGGTSGASGAAGGEGASGASGAAGAASPRSAAGAAGAAGTAPGPARVLEIGGSVPTTDSVFVRAEGRDDIGIVPSSAVSALLRTPDELRDHTLLDTTALDVFETLIDRKGAESLRFRRRDGAWWMEEPLQDAAEGSAVQGLLTTLIGLRADRFEEDSASSGLDVPAATIRLSSEKGALIAEIAFGAEVPGEAPKRYVRVTAPGQPPVVALVPSPDLSAALGPPVAFRARKALSFRSWDAQGVNLTSPGVTLSFARKDGAWSAVSPAGLKLSHDAVDATLQEIADLSIVDFDAAKGKPPSALGLEPAKTKVEIRLAEPSSRTISLVLGDPAGAPNVLYASTPGRPVFTVPSSILERIRGGASLYEEKPAPAAAAPGASSAPAATGSAAAPSTPAAPAAPAQTPSASGPAGPGH